MPRKFVKVLCRMPSAYCLINRGIHRLPHGILQPGTVHLTEQAHWGLEITTSRSVLAKRSWLSTIVHNSWRTARARNSSRGVAKGNIWSLSTEDKLEGDSAMYPEDRWIHHWFTSADFEAFSGVIGKDPGGRSNLHSSLAIFVFCHQLSKLKLSKRR